MAICIGLALVLVGAGPGWAAAPAQPNDPASETAPAASGPASSEPSDTGDPGPDGADLPPGAGAPPPDLLRRWAAGVPGARVVAAGDPALGPLLVVPARAGVAARGAVVLVGPSLADGRATAYLTVDPLVEALLSALPAAGWQVFNVQPPVAVTDGTPVERLNARLAFALSRVDAAAGPVVIMWLGSTPAFSIEPLVSAMPRLDLRAETDFVPEQMGLAGFALIDVRWPTASLVLAVQSGPTVATDGTSSAEGVPPAEEAATEGASPTGAQAPLPADAVPTPPTDVAEATEDARLFGEWLAEQGLPILWLEFGPPTASGPGSGPGEVRRALALGLPSPRLLRHSMLPGVRAAPRALGDGVVSRVLGFLFTLTDADARKRAYEDEDA